MATPLSLAPAAFLVAAGLLSEGLGDRAEELNAAFLRCEAQAQSPSGLTRQAETDLLLTWRSFHQALATQAQRVSESAGGPGPLDEVVTQDARFLEQARREGAFTAWKAHHDELTASLRKAHRVAPRVARVASVEAR